MTLEIINLKHLPSVLLEQNCNWSPLICSLGCGGVEIENSMFHLSSINRFCKQVASLYFIFLSFVDFDQSSSMIMLSSFIYC